MSKFCEIFRFFTIIDGLYYTCILVHRNIQFSFRKFLMSHDLRMVERAVVLVFVFYRLRNGSSRRLNCKAPRKIPLRLIGHLLLEFSICKTDEYTYHHLPSWKCEYLWNVFSFRNVIVVNFCTNTYQKVEHFEEKN